MNKINIAKELKKIEAIEKAEHKKIDNEVALENEIDEVSKHVAKILKDRPMTGFGIQGRHFVVAHKMYKDENGKLSIEVVAREQLAIAVKTEKAIRANTQVDERYSLEENLIATVKGLLGHITGHIKAEEVE